MIPRKLRTSVSYGLCWIQFLYGIAYAGLPSGDLSSEQEPTRYITVDSAHRVNLREIDFSSTSTIRFKDQEGQDLGSVQQREQSLYMTWGKQPFILDFNELKSKSLTVESEGAIKVLNPKTTIPVILKADTIVMDRSFFTSAPFKILGRRAQLKNLESKEKVVLNVEKFENSEKYVIKAPFLALKSTRGINKGSLFAKELFLEGDWSNHHCIETDVFQVVGDAYYADSSSDVVAHLAMSVKVKEYTEYGKIRALLQSILGNRISYRHSGPMSETVNPIRGDYFWLQADYLYMGPHFGLEMENGIDVRIKKGSELMGHMCVGENSFSQDSNKFADAYASLIPLAQRTPTFSIKSREELRLRPESSVHLGKRTKSRIESKKKVAIEGSIPNDESEALKIIAPIISLENAVLPSCMVLEGDRIFIGNSPDVIERLTVRGPSMQWLKKGKTIINIFDAPHTWVRALESPLEIQKGVMGQAVIGQLTLHDFLRLRSEGFFEDVTGTKEAILTSPESLSIIHLQGSLVTEAKNVTVQSANGDRLDIKAQEKAKIYSSDVDALEVKAKEVLIKDVAYKKAKIQGEKEVALAGNLGRDSSSTIDVQVRDGDLNSHGDFKGDVSLRSLKGQLWQGGTFAAGSTVHMEAFSTIGLGGKGQPAQLNVRVPDAKEFLIQMKAQDSLLPRSLTIHGDNPIDLAFSPSVTQPFHQLSLKSEKSIDARLSQVGHQSLELDAPRILTRGSTFTGENLSLRAKRLDTEDSTVKVKSNYTRIVKEDLKAAREHIQAKVNAVQVGGNADFTEAKEEGIQQYFEIEGFMDVSSARLESTPHEREEMQPALLVHTGQLQGKAAVSHKGNWSHEYDELMGRPELICEGGPTVIVGEKGLWLEAPVMVGDTLKYGSMTGDVTITSVTLRDIKRWFETHKSKNWCGQTSKSTSSHEVRRESVVRPEIISKGTMDTKAQEGHVTLKAPTIHVGGDWSVYAKKFSVDAVAAVYHFNQSITKTSSSWLGGSSSSQSVKETRKEVVPPLLHINGHLYIYCDQASFESAQMYVGGVLHNHCRDLSFTAAERHQVREEHQQQKSIMGEAKQGYRAETKEGVAPSLNVGGIDSEEIIRFVGTYLTRRDQDGIPLNIQFEELKKQSFFSSYSTSNQNHLMAGATAIAGLAVTIATSGTGSSLMGIMANAAFSSFCATTAATFIQTGGDIEATVKGITSDGSLRMALIAAATAGVMDKAATAFEIPINGLRTLGERAAGGALRAGVTTGLNATIGQQDLATAATTGAVMGTVDIATGAAAQKIGLNQQKLGEIGHKAAHAGLGAVGGAAVDLALHHGENLAQAAASGAAGAIVAETMAQNLMSTNEGLSQEERLKEARRAADLGRLAGAAATLVIGHNTAAGIQAGTNAVENNFMLTAPAPAAMGASTLLTAVALKEANRGGEALKESVVSVGEAVVGVVKNIGDALFTPHTDVSSQKGRGTTEAIKPGILSTPAIDPLPPCPGFGEGLSSLNLPNALVMGIHPDSKSHILTTPLFDQKVSILSTPILVPQGPTVFLKDLETSGTGLTSTATKDEVRAATSAEKVGPPQGLSTQIKGPKVEKVHGNSGQYVGETHVYSIKNTETGQYVKIGESMQGVNKLGLSKRAEAQASKLRRETGIEHKTEIRRTFGTKAEARQHETKTIEKFRELHGKDKLPGNKGNR